MAGFEKTKLTTGEFRADYIARRLAEGASVKTVHGEINAPGFYSGPDGSSWPQSVVYAAQRKKPTASVSEVARTAAPEVDLDAKTVEVPPEYEDVLTSEDMAEIKAEAAAELKKEQRKSARKEMLARAKADLQREAAALAQQGGPRADMVDLTIDLAPYAADIRLDGRSYPHGKQVRVPRKVAAVLAEQMERSWKHQEGLSGANENAYRKPRMATINGRTGATTGTQGLRA